MLDIKNINIITHENAKGGTTNWELNNPAKKREIEGYASASSVNKGNNISFYINTQAAEYSLEIFRMGWYNGKGARSVVARRTYKGIAQNIPQPNTTTGLVECNWIHPVKQKTSSSWVTGVYLVKLEEHTSNKQSYIIFVIRDDSISNGILFQLPVTTYQAYNYWGGKSLYDWGSGSLVNWGSVSGKRASHVSFNRPYASSNNEKAAYGNGAGEFLTNIQPITTHFLPISSAGWDYNMVRWLEKNEYLVSYITNIDTHKYPKLLKQNTIFMSHGHDEYWTTEMRANVENCLKAGTNLTFITSNAAYWQVRLEPSILTEEPLKTLICYKEASLDPVKNNLATVNFRSTPVNKPEAKLLGVQHFMDPVDGDIIINKPEHWAFDGLKLKIGDKLEGLLGYEIDSIVNESPKNIEVLASSPGKNLLQHNHFYLIKISLLRIRRKIKTIMMKIKKLNNIIKLISLILITILFFLIVLILGIYNVLLGSCIFGSLVMIFLGLWYFNSMAKHNKTISTKGTANMTLYKTKDHSKVFATGSMQWCWGLDDYNSPQLRTSRLCPKAQKITHNILLEFGGSKGTDKT